MDGAQGTAATDIDFRSLAHAKAFAFCGIGKPAAFFEQLRHDNYQMAGTYSFADHYVYSQDDANAIDAKALAAGAGFLLTTPKDGVKLAALKFSIPCFVVISELSTNKTAIHSRPSTFHRQPLAIVQYAMS